MDANTNTHLLLIAAPSAHGKTASLRNLRNPGGVIYANFEAGKSVPFKNQFMKGADGKPQFVMTDPKQLPELIAYSEELPDVHTIVVDSLTFMMSMYCSVHVMTASDTQKAWGQYKEFFLNLMGQTVASSSKSIIFTAHTTDEYNETTMKTETMVKVQGSLMALGIEAFFSVVVAAKKKALKDLEAYQSPLLTITPQEEALGFKYVFQTQLTKDSVTERIRSPIDMWQPNETFINNDAQLVMDRLDEYYNN